MSSDLQKSDSTPDSLYTRLSPHPLGIFSQELGGFFPFLLFYESFLPHIPWRDVDPSSQIIHPQPCREHKPSARAVVSSCVASRARRFPGFSQISEIFPVPGLSSLWISPGNEEEEWEEPTAASIPRQHHPIPTPSSPQSSERASHLFQGKNKLLLLAVGKSLDLSCRCHGDRHIPGSGKQTGTREFAF